MSYQLDIEANIARAKEIFKKLKEEDAANKICFECRSANPQWASISYGIYICLECSGVHRSIGVHISFVRSLTMDQWSDQQLEKMRQGGNTKAKEFFKKNGVPDDSNIKGKYNLRGAVLYKDKLTALAESKAWKELESPSTAGNNKPSFTSSSSSTPKKSRSFDDWDKFDTSSTLNSANNNNSNSNNSYNKPTSSPSYNSNTHECWDEDDNGYNSSKSKGKYKSSYSNGGIGGYNSSDSSNNYNSSNSYSSSSNSSSSLSKEYSKKTRSISSDSYNSSGGNNNNSAPKDYSKFSVYNRGGSSGGYNIITNIQQLKCNMEF